MSIYHRVKNKIKSLIIPQKPTSLSKKRIQELAGKNNPVILEIGCANGDDSLEFLNTFQDASMRLYAFEPEPKNIAILKDRIKDTRFTLYEGVASDTDGEITFNRSRSDNPEDLSFSGSIMKPKKHLELWDWIYFDETITVQSTTLDTFCKEQQLPIIDFVWCDVQGAEEKVILGGTEAFKNNIRYFYTEYSNDEQYENQPRLDRILELLPSFEVVENFGSDILLKNKNL